MEDIELNIGGTSFKGVWIAVVLSFGTTLGGGIWATSEFFSRLEQLEENVEEVDATLEEVRLETVNFRDLWATEKKQLVSDISVMRSQLDDNDISGLQGKLAQLGTNLQTIMERQSELLRLSEDVQELEQLVTQMQVTVQKAETATANANEINETLTRVRKEIDQLWEGLDYLSNPYGS